MSNDISTIVQREYARISEYCKERELVWSSHFFEELPLFITPLSLFFHNRSFGEDGGVTGALVKTLGIGKPPGRSVLVSICGRTYTDLKALEELFSFPGLPVHSNLLKRQRRSPDRPLSYESIAPLSLNIPLLFLFPSIYLYTGAKTIFRLLDLAVEFHNFYHQKVLPGLSDYLDELSGASYRRLSSRELIDLLNDVSDHAACTTRKYWETGRFLSIITQKLLSWFVRPWDDADGTIASYLVKGFTGNPFKNMEQELWSLGSMARDDENVLKVLRGGASLSSLKKSAGGREWKDAYDTFLKSYGHLSDEEMELAEPRWKERPESTLRLVLSYAENRIPEPSKVQHINDERAREVAKEILGNLDCPVKRNIFLSLLGAARRYASYSDIPKFHFLKEIAEVRRLALALGESLKKEGKLEEREDIFHIRWPELPSLVYDHYTGKNMKELILERKRELSALKQISLPSIITCENSRSIIETHQYCPRDAGKPLFPGVARGKARKIYTPLDFEKMQSGDVIVSRRLHRAWTPLYTIASGLVSEFGDSTGDLTEIIKDYELPAVSELSGAMDRIPDGGKITVNGTSGKVTWLSE